MCAFICFSSNTVCLIIEMMMRSRPFYDNDKVPITCTLYFFFYKIALIGLLGQVFKQDNCFPNQEVIQSIWVYYT